MQTSVAPGNMNSFFMEMDYGRVIIFSTEMADGAQITTKGSDH